MTRTLEHHETQLLQRGLSCLAHIKRGHAQTLYECARSGGNAMITPEAAMVLAQDREAEIKLVEALANELLKVDITLTER